MVFQNFQLFPHQTAIENVMEGLVTVLKWPKDKARASARSNCSKRSAWPTRPMPGLRRCRAASSSASRSPARLRRRRACLLCDEPTSALDPELAEEVVEVLAQLAREGTTMVMATHDLRLASQVADQVVFLDAGVVVESGPAGAIFGNPERERTKRFIATLRQEQKAAGTA